MTGHDPEALRKRRAMRRISLAFLTSVAGSAIFAIAYVVGDRPQGQGAGLAIAFAGIAYGLATWAKYLLPGGDRVEPHEDFSSGPRAQAELVEDLKPDRIRLSRLGLLGLLGAALSALGGAALFPLRSLLAPHTAVPEHALRHTA